MRKSMLCLLSVAALAAMLLSACGPATPTTVPPAASVPPATKAPTLSGDIKIWVMPNGADPQAAIDAEIAAFNKLYPDVKVTAEIVGWGDAYGLIQTAVQGGEGPCITQLGTTWVPTFGTMGGLHEFTDAEIAALGGAQSFVQASWATAGVAGKVTSIPWFADVRALAYRKDILEKVGLTPDAAFKDIASFEATLQKIRDANLGVEPFVHPGRNDWNVWQNAAMWIWAYGGDLLSADGTSAAFNSPQAVAGVTEFDGLYGRGLTAPDTLELNSAQVDARFGDGSTAIIITGPWNISQARNPTASGWDTMAAENLAFAEFPAGPGGQYTFVGGSNLGIMKSCKNYDAAFAFVKYLLSKESQIRYGNAIGMLPVTLEAQNDPVFTQDPLFSVFIKAAAKGKTSMNIPAWGQVENTLQTALQGLWEDAAAAGLGKPIDAATVQARLDQAANTVNTLLKP